MTVTAARFRRSEATPLVLVFATVVVLFLAHVLQGPREVPLRTIAKILLGSDTTSFESFVVLSLRLPRALACLLAGASLGAAGFLLQTAMRNRLGEPHVFGLNAGASLAVVLVTTYPALAVPNAVMPLVAAIGAGLLFGLVLLLSLVGRNRFDPTRIVFLGIALSALAQSVVSAILLLDEDTVEALRYWLVGDAAGADFSTIATVLPPMAIGMLVGALIMPSLGAFALGEHLAVTLGSSVRRTRIAALAVAALLCGTAVTLVGPIGFVGLMAPGAWPHLHHRPSATALLLCALSGASLLLMADILAVGLLAPVELPTGALTGLAGAPFFVWLVARKLR